jgi:hypothetical protein
MDQEQKFLGAMEAVRGNEARFEIDGKVCPGCLHCSGD